MCTLTESQEERTVRTINLFSIWRIDSRIFIIVAPNSVIKRDHRSSDGVRFTCDQVLQPYLRVKSFSRVYKSECCKFLIWSIFVIYLRVSHENRYYEKMHRGIALNLQANISQSFDRVLVSLVLSFVYGPYTVLLNSKPF